MQKILVLLVLTALLCVPIYAATASHAIQGNPIGRRDDYTVNGHSAKSATVRCQFVNKGKVKADLNIWTSPKQTKPHYRIHLPGTNTKSPYRTVRNFTLKLKKHWWCRIYTPPPNKQWKRCSYFSISDATLSETRPFATWNKTTHSRLTYYSCSIQSPKTGIGFFFFKQ